ncbi:DUF427 domain-containing protein [Candidatus Raskinella chloraquaticus]|jgi:uncharacterized protein (DUF427 family)|uniref:DUF427 domain-containing protein n=1 Tax=Candidatus Raskinella chloraquaticus TaxID=1951219 RepID=A0A1W9HRC7_9HYPH|nr:MAG: hypothetical protein A4S15_13660 [Proteobacteria bacterium SG_bin8]
MKAISADHPITITPYPQGVRVLFAGEVLAQTRRALALKEGSYPPVLYIPRDDVRMDLFRKTSNATHCPYKGEASYYSALTASKNSENAAWSYEKPFDQMAQIKEYFAFYPNRVDAIETID